ncbi:MAG: hypothetical protein FJ102_03130 [Deltaproteobacteria bacterium]|nr:hypothetical protein [Deltaproteobacteria bacterium]
MHPFLAFLLACTSEPGPVPTEALPPLPPRLAERAEDRGVERPLREAVIAFTAEVRGEVEPCGCPTTPYGGFARRERLLARYREPGDPPLFVLDAGEMLAKPLPGKAPAESRGRAEAVMALAEATGLDAWAPGPLDRLVMPPEWLAARRAVSATWGPPFAAARVVERGGIRVGVVGLSAAVDGAPPRDAVSAVRDAMSGEADTWVVLSNAGAAVNRAVADGVAGLGAVLATAGENLEDPWIGHGAPVIETPGRGRYVTVLHLSLASTPGSWAIEDGGVWKSVASARERADAAGAGANVLGEAFGRDLATLAQHTIGRNVAVVSVRPLAPDLDGDTPLNALVETFHAEQLATARAEVGRPSALAYGTSAACSSCHSDRIASWGFDDHARAWASLESRQAARNPECVGCHSTGFGKPGGFSDLEPRLAESYKAVQCEACHGPMRGHAQQDGSGSTPITEATCRACHDAANSPSFDYAAYLRRISCSRMAVQDLPD